MLPKTVRNRVDVLCFQKLLETEWTFSVAKTTLETEWTFSVAKNC